MKFESENCSLRGKKISWDVSEQWKFLVMLTYKNNVRRSGTMMQEDCYSYCYFATSARNFWTKPFETLQNRILECLNGRIFHRGREEQILQPLSLATEMSVLLISAFEMRLSENHNSSESLLSNFTCRMFSTLCVQPERTAKKPGFLSFFKTFPRGVSSCSSMCTHAWLMRRVVPVLN